MAAPQSGLTDAQIIHMGHNLLAVKMYSLASFGTKHYLSVYLDAADLGDLVMLYYDIVLTFGDEVEYIWKRKMTWFSVLWFLNRYLSPLGFLLIILSFHDSSWTSNKRLCDGIVFFPEILRVFTTSIIGVIFIIRLYATYSRSRIILFSMSFLLVLEESVKIWSFTSGQRLQLPPEFVGCILTPSENDNLRFTFTWIAELCFDSIVFALTLYRTIALSRSIRGGVHSLVHLILRDGVVYFAVILVANLVTVLTFLLAPPDLKAVNASLTVAITPLMVSRLILNLRSADKTANLSKSDIPKSRRTPDETSLDGDIRFASRGIPRAFTTTYYTEDIELASYPGPPMK